MSDDIKKQATATARTTSNPMKELGVAGDRSSFLTQGFNEEAFLHQLRGHRGIRKYREMKDNSPIIGGILTAMEMMIRAVEWRTEPADDSSAAEAEAEFLDGVFQDMSHSWEDMMGEILSFLPFGFAWHEVVYKKRVGPDEKDPTKRSKFTDGRIGIRKIAPRAQWTIDRFDLDENGGVKGAFQAADAGWVYLPIEKSLLFRTTSVNNAPSGRSVLRNAYLSYHYASHITEIEAIAIEREMNGLPVGRVPAEYLGSQASAAQKAFLNQFETILRDVKLNEQGYVILPSDRWQNDDGSLTDTPLVEFDLVASEGTRAIPIGDVIIRHHQDMARAVLADFLMLGQSERGSFALSKSKTDLFLRSIEGYLNAIAEVFNRHLVPKLWALNGISYELMPKMVPGDVAPADLEELGAYVQRLAQAGAPLFPDEETENQLRSAADLPDAPDDPDIMGRPVQQPGPQQATPDVASDTGDL